MSQHILPRFPGSWVVIHATLIVEDSPPTGPWHSCPLTGYYWPLFAVSASHYDQRRAEPPRLTVTR